MSTDEFVSRIREGLEDEFVTDVRARLDKQAAEEQWMESLDKDGNDSLRAVTDIKTKIEGGA